MLIPHRQARLYLSFMSTCGAKTIFVPRLYWETLSTNSDYSEGFSRRLAQNNEEYELVVTIFKLPMTEDRKSGLKIGDNEWLEIFSTFREEMTMRLRLNKGDYWLLSRQTFKVGVTPVEHPKAYTFPWYESEIDAKDTLIRSYLQNEIDKTRYILRNEF
jgi:hypothetical protein